MVRIAGPMLTTGRQPEEDLEVLVADDRLLDHDAARGVGSGHGGKEKERHVGLVRVLDEAEQQTSGEVVVVDDRLLDHDRELHDALVRGTAERRRNVRGGLLRVREVAEPARCSV